MTASRLVLAFLISAFAGIGTVSADTLFTGVLSPDTAKLICKRAHARYRDFGADGYGCHNLDLMVSCRPSQDCVSRVRDLNSYMGTPLHVFLRDHGQRQVDPVSQSYSE